MRRCIVTPWDIAAIDQVVSLQKTHDLALMTVQEEKDYVEEFKPKDWFFLTSKDGKVLGFIRHFPHFSTSSWLQMVFTEDVTLEDLEFLWAHFRKFVFLEEADGFQFHGRDSGDRILKFLKGAGFSKERERIWFNYGAGNFHNVAQVPWEAPSGFAAAMKLTADESFLNSQTYSPFQERLQVRWKEGTDCCLRFDLRDQEIYMVSKVECEGRDLMEGLSSIFRETGALSVWCDFQIPLMSQGNFKEIIYSLKK